ncbi:MAG: PKD domain-containing protein [Planctomycetota bacterium]|jgi:PKD repeat protein
MLRILLPAVMLISLVLSAGSSLGGERRLTGCKPMTRKQEGQLLKNHGRVAKVRLNKIGLGRVNAARKKKGLGALKTKPARNGKDVDATIAGSAASDSGEGSEAPAGSLPSYLDNSTLKYFPPIRSQSPLPSCVSWGATYYQFTHTVSMDRDWDAKNGGDAYRFSPKWTYNFVNGGVSQGTYLSHTYSVLQKHGAATWAEFPYNSDYRGWCMSPAAWRNAINYRAEPYQYISSVSTTGLEQVKQLLNNGYVIVVPTYISSWQYRAISNDPATTEDDAFVGKSACHWVNGTAGGHVMTAVGYNDHIWVDVNGNGVVDAGEKGAMRIANSWGTGWKDAGFVWVAYDAFKAVSAVPGAPSSGRRMLLQSDRMYHLTVKSQYKPRMVARFTLNHARRNQLRAHLGTSNVGQTTPSSNWYPGYALSFAGGAYAFNGTTTAVDGTFYFDFTDLVPSTTEARRWFVGMYDNTAGDPVTIKGFQLYQVKDSGDLLVGTAANVPQTADGGQQKYAWIDYTYNSGNVAPTAVMVASPTSGNVPLPVSFDGTGSTDPDGNIVSYAWNFGDGGTAAGATVTHTYTIEGTYTASLTVTDDKGGTSQTTQVITVVDPNKINAPSGLAASVSGSTVTLIWTDNSGNETGFHVERGVKRKGRVTWTRAATVGANVTGFSETVANGTYRYRVQAFNSTTGQTSDYSNEVQAQVGSKGGGGGKGKKPKGAATEVF